MFEPDSLTDQLLATLAKLLRERFGASAEEFAGAQAERAIDPVNAERWRRIRELLRDIG